MRHLFQYTPRNEATNGAIVSLSDCLILSGLRLIRESMYLCILRPEQSFDLVYRNCKVEILPTVDGSSRDADDISSHIEKGASAAAGRDGRCDLQEPSSLFNRADRAKNAV